MVSRTKHVKGETRVLRVVLVDDEIRVCNLIRALVDWQSMDMEVSGVAHNGLEALTLIRDIKPEIVITDIRMPGCTGLELIEQIRDLVPDCAFIIISGYTHFEYAQMAIKFGVRDYLLKPIDQQELNAALRRLKEEFGERAREQMASDRIRRSLANDRRKIRSCYFMDVWNYHGPRMPLEQLNREYGFAFQRGLFRGMAIKMDHPGERYDNAALETVASHVRELLVTQLRPLCSDLELWFNRDVAIGLCAYPEKHRELISEAMQNCLNELHARKEMYPEITFSMAFGEETSETERVNDSVMTARRLLEERLIRGSCRVIDRDPELSGIPILENVGGFLSRIKLAFDRTDAEWAKEAISQLRAATLNERGVTGQEVWRTVSLAVERIAEETNDGQDYETLRLQFMEEGSQCGTAEALFGLLERMALERIDRLETAHQTDEARPIRAAKQYIDEHYMEPINLEQVAAEVGFNASYFSTVFKKKCGQGFVEYLTSVRIEKAKELLRQTDVPIAEVCAQIGYSDLKHFNRTFKKITELKPSEFKRLYGR